MILSYWVLLLCSGTIASSSSSYNYRYNGKRSVAFVRPPPTKTTPSSSPLSNSNRICPLHRHHHHHHHHHLATRIIDTTTTTSALFSISSSSSSAAAAAAAEEEDILPTDQSSRSSSIKMKAGYSSSSTTDPHPFSSSSSSSPPSLQKNNNDENKNETTKQLQQQNEEEVALLLLYNLIVRNSKRPLQTSSKYHKGWKNISRIGIQSIQTQLLHNLPTPINQHGFQSLWYNLGIAADIGQKPTTTIINNLQKTKEEEHQQQQQQQPINNNTDKTKEPTTTTPSSSSTETVPGSETLTDTDTNTDNTGWFTDSGSRSGYAIDFMSCRVQLLADLLFSVTIPSHPNPTFSPNFQQQIQFQLPHSNTTTTTTTSSSSDDNTTEHNNNNNNNSIGCHLLSLGGGPGFDFVALALVAYHHSGGNINHIHVTATILDYEEGWYDLVDSMTTATQKLILLQNKHDDKDEKGQGEKDEERVPTNNINSNDGNNNLQSIATSTSTPNSSIGPILSCKWGGKCDITKSIFHFNNQNVKKLLSTCTNLITCQYCIAENLIELQQSNYIFFQELIQYSTMNCLFLLTETTSRIWPDLYVIFQTINQQQQQEYNNANQKNQKNNQTSASSSISSTASNYQIEIGFPLNIQTKKQARQMSICKVPMQDTIKNDTKDKDMMQHQEQQQQQDEENDEQLRQVELNTLIQQFQQYNICHQRKVQQGWERQPKRVNGNVYKQQTKSKQIN